MQKNSIIDRYTRKVEEMLELDLELEERYTLINSLNECYFGEVGENLPSFLLEMLGTWCLKETYSDKRTNKVAMEEFPVLTESQLLRRRRKTVHVDNEYVLETLNYHLRNNSSTSKRYEDEYERGNFYESQH